MHKDVKIKNELTLDGLITTAFNVNSSIATLSTATSAIDKDNAIQKLKNIYFWLSGEAYNVLSSKIKPVDAEELKSSVTELSSRLGAMESIPEPNAADIGNKAVKKAAEAVLRNDDFGKDVVANESSTIDVLATNFALDDVDKIFDIVSRLSKELLTYSILDGADWSSPLKMRIPYDQWYERAFAEMTSKGIENKVPFAVKRLIKLTTELLARIAKQEVAKEISRSHSYGEREVFIKNTCDRLFKNRSGDSKKIAEKSLFSKTDKRGNKSEAKTLGSMPVKEIKKHIEGCADFFGGYVPMIRYERFSERGKAGTDNGEFVISVGSNTNKATIWHEIAHHTERSLPWVLDLTTNYLVKKFNESDSKRKIQELRGITGSGEYKIGEIAIVNKSAPDPYVLKLYPPSALGHLYVRDTDGIENLIINDIKKVSATEVLSMGAGYLADGSLHKYSHDVDFVSTVLTIVERLQKEGKEWDTL